MSKCNNRKVHNSKLFTLAFGNPCTVNVDPIEKKPLFHFFPGSSVFSLGTIGCNFHCRHCQNWEIAHEEPCERKAGRTEFLEPKQVVALAKEAGSKGISWTYNEPTMWLESTARTNEMAKREGLYGFTAEVLLENKPMLHLFSKMGFDIQKRSSQGVYELQMAFKGA